MYYLRQINNSYRVAFFSGAFDSTRMLIGAIQALYLLSTGVSLNELTFLKAYFALVVLILDVPLGVVSDLISNKICVCFSCIFISCYYLTSLFAPNFILLLLAESCYAIGLCLASGSIESLLIQSVKKDYPNVDSKISYFYFLSNEIMAIGSMITAPLGVVVFLIHGGMYSIYLLSSFFMLLLPMLIYKIDEVSFYQNKNITNINKDYFQSLYANTNNWIYIFVASLIVIAYQPLYHFWQPFFIQSFNEGTLLFSDKNTEQNTAIILGLIFFIYSLSNYLFSKLAKNKLTKYNSRKPMLLISILLILLVIFMVFIKQLYLLIILFSSIHGCMSIFSNLTRSVLIRETQQQQIATVISLANVIGRFLSTIVLFICSLWIDANSIQYIFFLTLISIMFATWVYLKRFSVKGEKDVSLSID